MIRVMCRKCGCIHYAGHDHACQAATGVKPAVVANAPRTVANIVPVVANAVANRHGRYADAEKRRAYMRDYMKRRRATAPA